MDRRYRVLYSERIKGDEANHDQDVRFDYFPGGSIGVSQYHGHELADRVLFTRAQVKALIAFAESRGRTVKRTATKRQRSSAVTTMGAKRKK